MNITVIKGSDIYEYDGNNSTSENTLEGKTLIVSVTEMLPYVSIIKHRNGSVKTVKGYLADIWFLIQDSLKFRTTFIDSGPGFLGENKNGTWDGMVGELQHKRADIGLANLGITPERRKVVDFSSSVAYDTSKLLSFSSARLESVDWMTFVTTLSWKVWVFVAVLWIVTSILLAFVSRTDTNKPQFTYIFCLFGAITMQGSELIPQRTSGRIMFISFWGMCVIIHASFTALLTTHLTTAKYEPLSSLQQALDMGFGVCVIRGTLQHQKIIESKATNVDFQRVYEMFNEDDRLLVSSFEEGMERTYDGKTLFLYDSNILRFRTAANCSFTQHPPDFFKGFLHMPMRKNFEHEYLINERILRLTSSGILQRIAKKWLRPPEECQIVNDETHSLGLNKSLFAFVVVSSGVVVSVLLLILEIFARRKYKKRSQFSYSNEKMRRRLQRMEMSDKHDLIFPQGKDYYM